MTGNFVTKGIIINKVEIISEDSKEIVIPYTYINLFNRFSKFKYMGKSGENIDVVCVYRHYDIGIVFKKIGFDSKMFKEEEFKKFEHRADIDSIFDVSENYKIRIKACSGGLYSWYGNKIGEIFDAVFHGNSKVDFVVTKQRDYHRPATDFLVSISDCDIIEVI